MSTSGLSVKTFPGQHDLLALHHFAPQRYPHLLESAAVSKQARYSILFAFPGKTLSAGRSQASQQDFLQALDAWCQQKKIDSSCDLPFHGGWYLFIAYEFAQILEPSLHLPPDKQIVDVPTAIAQRFPCAVIVDHQQQVTHIVCEMAYHAHQQQIYEDMQQAKDLLIASKVSKKKFVLQEDGAKSYLNGIEKIKQYILNGDVFQVNLSRAWCVDLHDDITASYLYQLLRQGNPAPFSALSVFDDFAIISSSPERLIQVKAKQIETRPIAGSRPRGDNQAADQLLAKQLLDHPKENAEHIMLIDLARNDLGRLCVPGSVCVDELMTIESYQHVHHIVSNVKGQLGNYCAPSEILSAVFPGGTITGCPKIRCMEIIAELEQTGRGVYTGSLGYLNRNGDMDLNILIRTIAKQGKQLHFRTGAGIVADSIAEKELQESRYKAEGILRIFER